MSITERFKRRPQQIVLAPLAVAPLLSCLVLCGCGDSAEIVDPGYLSLEPASYPAPPYGLEVGATIPNWTFRGFPTEDNVDGKLRNLRLSDFYNPPGDGIYEEGSPYAAGAAKPKLLLLTISAEWCAPSRFEVETLFPSFYEELRPHGLEILFLLGQSQSPPAPATLENLRSWSTAYEMPYPIGLDLDLRVMDLMPTEAFPSSALIRTSDMQIIRVITGADTGVLTGDAQDSLRALLTEAAVCNSDDICDLGEDSASCAADCGALACGNEVCQLGEDATNCPVDCRAPLVCGDLSESSPAFAPCDLADSEQCLCEGCVDDGICGDPERDLIDDCVCPDCAGDPACSAAANCNLDGLCNPYNEGCACPDCVSHPQCH